VLSNSTLLVLTPGANASGTGGPPTAVRSGAAVAMKAVMAAAALGMELIFVPRAPFSLAVFPVVSSPAWSSIGTVTEINAVGGNVSLTISLLGFDSRLESAEKSTVFKATLLSVVRGRLADGSPCQSNVTLEFSCEIGPLRPGAELRKATRAAYLASTALSSLTGNPVSAMPNIVLASLLQLPQCSFSLVDPLDGPIPVSFGEQEGQYMRGEVAVAIGMIAGPGLLLVAVASLAPGFSAREMLARLRMPSITLIPIGMFLLSLTQSAVVLLRIHKSSSDVAMSVAGLLLCLFCIVGALLGGTRWNRCRIGSRSKPKGEQSSWLVVRGLVHLTHSNVLWFEPCCASQVKLEAAFQGEAEAPLLSDNLLGTEKHRPGDWPGCKRQLRFILNDTKPPWWAALELSSLLATGLVLGFRDNDAVTCRSQAIALAVVSLGMFAAACLVRPFGSISGNFFLFVSTLGACVVNALVVFEAYDESDRPWSAAAEIAVLVLGFFACCQTGLQALSLIHDFATRLLKPPKATSNSKGSVAAGATQPTADVNIADLMVDIYDAGVHVHQNGAEIALQPVSQLLIDPLDNLSSLGTADATTGRTESAVREEETLEKLESSHATRTSQAADRFALYLGRGEMVESKLLMPLASDAKGTLGVKYTKKKGSSSGQSS
jgi:hypothetical protein